MDSRYHKEICDYHFSTIMRVPGPSGDSEFHCEFLSDEGKIKTEPGIEAPAKNEFSQTREDQGIPDRLSFGRGFDDKKIKDANQS